MRYQCDFAQIQAIFGSIAQQTTVFGSQQTWNSRISHSVDLATSEQQGTACDPGGEVAQRPSTGASQHHQAGLLYEEFRGYNSLRPLADYQASRAMFAKCRFDVKADTIKQFGIETKEEYEADFWNIHPTHNTGKNGDGVTECDCPDISKGEPPNKKSKQSVDIDPRPFSDYDEECFLNERYS